MSPVSVFYIDINIGARTLKSIHLIEPALDVTEPGVRLAPLGSAGLLRRVGREVEPGQPHAATQERPSLHL